MTTPKPVVLCILDGWGLSDARDANAPVLPNAQFRPIMAAGPHATLVTHGPDVGLPRGQMGNSEVGHTNIGAGRVVAMDLGQIDLAIEDGSFRRTKRRVAASSTRKKTAGGTAHLMGVVSDGGRAWAPVAHPGRRQALTGGGRAGGDPCRDRRARRGAPSARPFVPELATRCPRAPHRHRDGRYFAMDRDNRWDRVETYGAMVAAGRQPPPTRRCRGAATLCARQDRRVHRPDGDGRLRPAPWMATGSSASTSAPTGRARSCAGGRPGFRCLRHGRAPTRRRCWAWWNIPTPTTPSWTPSFPSARDRQHAGRMGGRARAAPVPHRRDRKIPACHLLS